MDKEEGETVLGWPLSLGLASRLELAAVQHRIVSADTAKAEE